MATTQTSSPTTTLAPTTTELPPTTSTTEPVSTTQATAVRAFDFDVPFTAAIPAEWRIASESSRRILYLERGSSIIVFSTYGPETVEEWRTTLTGEAGLVSSEPTEAPIDGAAGFWLDVSLSEEATNEGCFGTDPCVVLISDAQGWVVFEGFPNRIWVVDVEGEVVFIAAEAAEGQFADVVAEVEALLATLTWNP
ncbi:MAG: hypothetical protein R3258_06660 [Acidimicrobiia bacterium]|nr:hypothetical protein [Acidimicrobiia bacterium]